MRLAAMESSYGSIVKGRALDISETAFFVDRYKSRKLELINFRVSIVCFLC